MATERQKSARIRILDPVAVLEGAGQQLARRPQDLNGKVLVLFDNLPRGLGGGELGMNEIYERLQAKLEQRVSFAEVLWKIKPKRGAQAPSELMDEVVNQGQVVINGSCT
ncbi:MAG: hypothetical protein HYY45_09615 [Deltaproteobacteria bacterium]|nr:hypothetical protein [Deltaproteobacteria bacterium]